MEAKDEDADVLGGGRQGNELRNPGGKGEQWEVSGGVERQRTRNESREGGSERTATKQQEEDKREAKIRGHGDKRAEVAREQESRGSERARGTR